MNLMKRIINIVILAAMVVAGVYFLVSRFVKKDFFESKDKEINIYLVSYGNSGLKGRPIGCNDILVPISKTISGEISDLESALNELLAQKETSELHTFVKGPGLLLYKVLIADGKAEVYLKGDFEIRQICAIDHIKEQLYATASQFTEYREVKFYIGNQTLEKYLSIARIGL
jgi:hypothetical protein